MTSFLSSPRRVALPLFLLWLGACGSPSTLPDSVKKRNGTVVVESCGIDPWQTATLEADDTRAVVGDVILICLYVRDGIAEPLAPADRASVSAVVASLQQRGYRVQLGVTTGEDPTAGQSTLDSVLADSTRRAALTASISAYAPLANGITVVPPALAAKSEASFRAFVSELSAAVPNRKISLFAPPQSMTPSDVPAGDAIKLAALANQLSHSYLMTLDLHCCDGEPGPTTASDWISTVVSFARPQVGTSTLSFSLPLYGTYFGNGQRQRQVSYLEAAGLAAHHHIEVRRHDDTDSLYFTFSEAGGVSTIYFDDSQSLLRTLSEVDQQVPAEVGVLYYGLGSEDPALFRNLKERMK